MDRLLNKNFLALCLVLFLAPVFVYGQTTTPNSAEIEELNRQIEAKKETIKLLEETISKYRILGFVEQMELDDNLRYLTMKNDPIVVSLEMPCTFTGMKSRYTATWGNDIRACG